MLTEVEMVARTAESDIAVKYNASNPIVRWIMKNYFRVFEEALSLVPAPKLILDIGAGEGYLSAYLSKKYPQAKIYSVDIENKDNDYRKGALSSHSNVLVDQGDIHALKFEDNFFDLVVCSEVLEHVTDPAQALREMRRVTKKTLFLSVPHEPIWCLMNLARGSYIQHFGNTPGHINHWTPPGLKRLVRKNDLNIRWKSLPLPFICFLLEK